MFDFGSVVIELSLMTGDSQNILYNLRLKNLRWKLLMDITEVLNRFIYKYI